METAIRDQHFAKVIIMINSDTATAINLHGCISNLAPLHVIQKLVDLGVHTRIENIWNPLFTALITRQEDIAILLRTNGVTYRNDVLSACAFGLSNYVDKFYVYDSSNLVKAATYGHEQVLRVLIAHGQIYDSYAATMADRHERPLMRVIMEQALKDYLGAKRFLQIHVGSDLANFTLSY